jgi:hypothetical protein
MSLDQFQFRMVAVAVVVDVEEPMAGEMAFMIEENLTVVLVAHQAEEKAETAINLVTVKHPMLEQPMEQVVVVAQEEQHKTQEVVNFLDLLDLLAQVA